MNSRPTPLFLIGKLMFFGLAFPILGFGVEPVKIPLGNPIQVDGKANPLEWQDAKEIEFIGGECIKMKQDGQYLYLCIKGETMGVTSLALNVGEEVKIFHASSGLITATYKKDGNQWFQQTAFRSGKQSQYPRNGAQARIDYNLQHFQWCATLLPSKGPVDVKTRNVTEYKINLNLFESRHTAVALAFFQRTAKQPMAFMPKGLQDDVLKKQLVLGSNVDATSFHPSTWLQIQW